MFIISHYECELAYLDVLVMQNVDNIVTDIYHKTQTLNVMVISPFIAQGKKDQPPL